MDQQEEGEAPCLHDGKVDEPQDALAEETATRVVCAGGTTVGLIADPIESFWEDDSVSSCDLPDGRHNHVESCEEVLVHDVFPGHQQLVQEHLAEQDHDRHDQRGHESLVSEARFVLVALFVASVVCETVFLRVVNICSAHFLSVGFGQLVELADLSSEHVLVEDGKHDRGGEHERCRNRVDDGRRLPHVGSLFSGQFYLVELLGRHPTFLFFVPKFLSEFLLDNLATRRYGHCRHRVQPQRQDPELQLRKEGFGPDVDQDAPYGESKEHEDESQSLRALKVEIVSFDPVHVLIDVEKELRQAESVSHYCYAPL